jgi:hypothetical protein
LIQVDCFGLRHRWRKQPGARNCIQFSSCPAATIWGEMSKIARETPAARRPILTARQPARGTEWWMPRNAAPKKPKRRPRMAAVGSRFVLLELDAD